MKKGNFIYHVRNEVKAIIGTVAFSYNETSHTVNRGVAIVSPRDQPNRKLGRRIAEGRLAKAQTQKTNRNEIKKGSESAFDFVNEPSVGEEICYKETFMGTPTEFETMIMEKAGVIPVLSEEEEEC